MSLFDKLAHQIPAKGEDSPPQPFSISIVRATDIDEFVEAARGYHLGGAA
jgi:hypothetical protein